MMATLAEFVSQLSQRVATLEDRMRLSRISEAAAQPLTTIINQKGEIEPSEEMEWAHYWDGESAYDKNDVVKWNGKLWICIQAVAEKAAKLSPLPPPGEPDGLAELRKLEKPITQYINPGETIEGELEPTFPPLLGNFFGHNIAAVYQFRTPAGSKITLPENAYAPPPGGLSLKLEYGVYNSDGKLILSNFLSFKEQEVTGGEKESNLFFLVIYAVEEALDAEKHIIYVKPTYPVPFILTLSSSGGLVVEPLNKKPSEDELHWLEIAVYGSGGATLPPKGAANEVIVWKAAGEGQWALLKDANVSATAAIAEAKLSLPNVVKLAGEQTITGIKIFAQAIFELFRFSVGTAQSFALAENNNVELSSKSAFQNLVPEAVNCFISGMSLIGGMPSNSLYFVHNSSATKTLTFLHQSEKSELQNRFKMPHLKPITLQPQEQILFFYNGVSGRWEPILGNLITPWADSTVSTLAYPFMAPIILGAKVENGAVTNGAVRIEQQGAKCFLRGAFKIKVGETLEPGELVCTLPERMRPATAIEYVIGSLGLLKISITGEVTLSKKLLAGEVLSIDGIAFERKNP